VHLTFVETLVFTTRWRARFSDDALRVLQNELLRDPKRGDPIPGCGIIRKMRFADAGAAQESGAECV
jgi:hypothetical protein